MTTTAPTPTSNWLIPHRILWGDTPNTEKLSALVNAGVTHFIDLRRDATNYIGTSSLMRYSHFPIQNYLSGALAHCEALCTLTSSILDEIRNDARAVIYFHDQDGATQSCVLACGIIVGHAGVTPLKAINIVTQLHATRKDTKGIDTVISPPLRNLVRECFHSYTPASVAVLPSGEAAPVPAVDGLNLSDTQTLSSTAGGPAPSSRRFQNTKGFGGGESQLNVFGGSGGGYDGTGNDLNGTNRSTGSASTSSTISLPQSAGQGNGTPMKVGRKFIQGHAPGGGGAQQIQLFGSHSTPHPHAKDNVSEGSQTTERPGSRPSSILVFPVQRSSYDTPWGLDLEGLRILQVSPGSASAMANVHPGDIVSINGLDVTHEDQLTLLGELLEAQIGVRTNRAGGAPSGSAPQIPLPPPSTALPSQGNFSLPPILDVRRDQNAIKGPIPTSNWVIRGSVLCGSAPNFRDKKKFHALLDTGINVFVNLTETADCSYIEAAEAATRRTFRILCFPIPDGGVPSEDSITRSAFSNFINDVLRAILSGGLLYIHCAEGHGRTCTVVAILLAKLYGLTASKALSLCFGMHKGRGDDGGLDCPCSLTQRTFVQTFLGSS